MVADLIATGRSQTSVLKLLEIAASTWHRRRNPGPAVTAPVAHTARGGSHWLTDAEISAITADLMDAFDAEKSVYQAYFEAFDAGAPVASLKSWYRIAAAYLQPCRPVRRRRNHRCCAMPQWEATAPNQVWSWDITMLPAPYRGVNYCFYVTIDVFSRKIVGWRVEEREVDELAEDMFHTAFTAEATQPRIVHSDRGASMTSKTLKRLFTDLGITISRNRPRVSNDNPFSESWFKTAKHSPGYPRHFESLAQATAWAAAFVDYYNHHHRHSALEGHTPADVHDGTWITVHHARQATLDALYAANPNRYPRPPQVRTPLAHVVLNKENPEHRLQPG